MAVDGRLVFDTKLSQTGFEQGMKRLQGIAAKGAAVTAAALAGISAAAIKVGSDFEASFAKASTLFGDVGVDTENLQGKMLELSKSTGIAATALSDSLYNALSAGIPATKDMSKATQYLSDSAKMAAAGFTDVDTVVTATAKVLNAYKMDVDQTADVHKILMQVQNKGITTVGELGSVLSQVTPTAAALSVSFEQVGAALATMTAQGIPTAQATTMLNSLFAELGKQGQQAQQNLVKATEGTKYAGLSFAEMAKQGVPLNEILNLMDTYAQKSGKALIDMFGSIEAGKAALSMSGQNAQQYTSNLQAMGTQADVVGDAYEKVTDTLEHQSEVLKNSFKTTGIQIYEYLKEPLKEAAKAGIEALDSLSKSLQNGALGDSVKRLGKSFGDFATATANFAAKALPKLINGLSTLIDNAKGIAVALLAAKAATLAWKASSVITGVVRAYQTAALQVGLYAASVNVAKIAEVGQLAALTAKEVIVGVLTGKIGLATAAQYAWNTAMNANPVGIVLVAITALAGGLGMLSLATKDTESESENLTNKLQEQKEAWESLQESQARQQTSDLAQISNAKDLFHTLQDLVDVNGQVKAGNEAQAEYIVGVLNNALGTELEIINGQIQGYGDLSGKIDEVVAKKQAEAIINAGQPLYEEALAKENELVQQRAAKQQELNEKQAEYNELKALDDNGLLSESEKIGMNSLGDEIKEKIAGIADLDKQIEENAHTIVQQNENIKNYSTGCLDAIKPLFESSQDFITAAGGASVEMLKGQYDAYTDLRTKLEQEWAADSTNAEVERRLHVVKENQQKAWNELVAAANDAVTQTKNIAQQVPALNLFDNFSVGAKEAEKKVKDALQNISGAAADGWGSGLSDSQDAANNALIDFTKGLIDPTKKALEVNSPSKLYAREIGKSIADGIAKGITDGKSGVANAIVKLAKDAVKEGKETLGIHSPSKVMAQKVGKPISQGIAKGIADNAGEAAQAAVELAKKTLDASKEWIENEKFYNRLDTAGELAAWQRLQQQYTAGSEQRIEADKKVYSLEKQLQSEALQDSKSWIDDQKKYHNLSLVDELAAWERVQSRYLEGTEERKQAEQELYRVRQELTKEIDSLEKSYTDKLDSRVSQIKGAFGLFDKLQLNDDVYESDLINAVDANLKAMERYRDAMADLSTKGLSDGMMEEIRGKGVKALPKIEVLLAMDPDVLAEIDRKFQRTNELAQDQASLELTGFREDIDGQIDVLQKALDGEQEEMLAAGQGMSEGMAQGICDGLSGVVNAAVDVARAAVAAAKTELDMHSPSKKFKTIGLMSDEGWAAGIKEGAKKLKEATQFAAAVSLPGAAVAQNIIAETVPPASNSTASRHTVVKEKVVGVQFTGSGAEIARMLRPKLVQEERIVGKSLLKEW